MFNKADLNNEEILLVLCSRTSLTNDEEKKIEKIINNEFNIDRFIALSIKHKVLPLVSRHIIRLDKESKINPQYKRLMEYNYLGNKQKNKAVFQEFTQILKEFNKNNIKAIPLKGTILVSEVYKDEGLRNLNDLDFLISIDDRSKVSRVLQNIGYQIGDYNWATDEIIRVSRKKEIWWKMNEGNLYPHVKKLEDGFAKISLVDFSYDVDLSKNYASSTNLFESSVSSSLYGVTTFRLNKIDFLIHLAIHLFKEASNVQWVLLHQELNLIKFCDIREYIIKNYEELDWNVVSERAKELSAEKALFYSLFYIDYIYGDDQGKNILELLNITDVSFIEEYGMIEYGDAKKWKKNFTDRFFRLSNKDEIVEKSKYEQLKER